MRIFGVVVTVAFILSGCVANNIEAETKPIKDSRVINLAKTLVSERMRDPEATRFKNGFSAYQTKRGDYIVCGTVNAKNAMGGYVGYKQFYVRIRNNEIAAFNLPDENDEYGIVASTIKKVCTDAAAGKLMVSS